MDLPVSHRIGKKADSCVQVLLDIRPDRTEIVDSDLADLVAMEKNDLERDFNTNEKDVAISDQICFNSAFFIV